MRFPIPRFAAAAIVAFLATALSAPAVPTQTPAAPRGTAALAPNEVARLLGNAFAAIAEKVSPSVVIITVSRQGLEGEGMPWPSDEPPEGPFDFFPRGPRRMPAPREPGESQGSGFIVRADGYIYTNCHVIQGAEKIKVRLKDGRSFDAQVVGVPDEKTDVAVIKINAKGLPAVEIGDSDTIRPGEWTIAIGAPFNLDYSVTVGVLSGKVRDRLGAAMYEEYLQTQATINPGNSGGPLLDIEGRVIGINTLIRTRNGAGFSFYNANVGFAIPIKLAQKVGDLLITKGRVERPWIGVDIRSLSEDLEIRPFAKGLEKGVVIKAIRHDGPAYHSGLRPADIVTAIDGTPVATARELQKQVLDRQIGQVIRLSVVREGKPITIEVKTGLQPAAAPTAARQAPPPSGALTYGMILQPVTKEVADQYSLSEKSGLLIMEVADDSVAARAGLTPGMVITEVDGKKVVSPLHFREAMRKAEPKRGALLQISRDGTRSFVILRMAPGNPSEDPEPMR
ncbi:MAG: trypsin-like peptidase domain-containing protein [Verrucomicrobiae bacterium]|nr:trypsin-like peptidase domain-containing protein [Verrucomicrobiae bacterium]